MKVCSKCGARIYVDSQNCTICGAPLIDGTAQQNQPSQQYQQSQPSQQYQQNQPSQQNQRRIVYEGEIHKCPHCGEILNSFTAICPTCGNEIRGVSTANSISEFYSKLEQMQSDEEKSNLIRYFPIPNSKEDIYEFFILASTNFRDRTIEPTVSEAWAIKIEQCYQKAKLSFSNTDDLSQIQQTYDELKKRLHKAKKKGKRKRTFHLIIKSIKTIISIIAKTLHLIIRNLAVIIGIILMIVAVNVNTSGNNSSVIELISYIILIVSASLLKRSQFILDYGVGLLSGAVTIVLSLLLNNSSMGELCGGAVIIIVAVNYFRYLSRKSGDSNQTPSAPANTVSTPTNTNPSPTAPVNTISNAYNSNQAPPSPVNAVPNTYNTNQVPVPVNRNNYSNQVPANTNSNAYNTRTSTVHGGTAKIPSGIANESNYAVVESRFLQAGFVNVRTVPLKDLTLGIRVRAGTVETITIDGKDISSYTFKRRFDCHVPILITYHSLR